jgi:uncharacterized membrane protein
MSNPLEDLELRISKVLRWGVILSGIIMLVGWIPLLGNHDPFAAFKSYQEAPLLPVISGYFEQHDWAMLTCYLGLAVLICLPALRVILTAILFMKQGEKTLATIASFVMIALIISFCLGGAG